MTITSQDFQLCQSITEDEAKLMNEKEWIANPKMDGERIIAVVMDGQAVLINRRGHLCNFSFEEVVEDVSKMPNGIYDGEVVSLCDTFTKLQRRAGTKDRRKQIELKKEIPVKLIVFDILNINKQYITSKPLKERVKIMEQVFEEFNKKFTGKPCVEMIEYTPIKEMLEKAHKEDREGVVIKKWDSIYDHKRSPNWLKCKFFLETTIKVSSYTVNPKGIRVEDDIGNAVQVSGNQSIEVKRLLDTQKEVEIYLQYLEKTEDGRYRFPSFRGLVK